MLGVLWQLGVLVLFVVVAVGVFVLGDRLRPKSWRHNDDAGAGHMTLDMVNGDRGVRGGDPVAAVRHLARAHGVGGQGAGERLRDRQ
ncbi:hypothetical protein GCM10010198_47720 [Nocardia seriolae]|nr:hypothetical protein NSERKGN1266_28410 [Nocardia seriolae]GEM24156.1 hypothetical protein NS2_23950 [Nocardia seriolae NBRC 15557]